MVRERDSEGGERGRHAESLRSDVIFVFYSCVHVSTEGHSSTTTEHTTTSLQSPG